MYIVNQHNILHSVPDDWAIPAGMRKATTEEISAFEATGEQETDREKAAKSGGFKEIPITDRVNQPNQVNTLGGGGTAGTMNQPADHGVHNPASQSGNTPANYSGNQRTVTARDAWAANPNQPANQRAAPIDTGPWEPAKVDPVHPNQPKDQAKVTLPKK